MEGPKAPKDPEKKLPGFYIVREKEIFGTEQPDKRGGHFLYENDGRLINSAQISGNITDVRILEALKTAEGFRSLVKSIGICIEAGDSCQELEFVFQMYGKKDIYGGGTLITGRIPADGVEHSISLSGISWSEDDKEPGRFSFILLYRNRRLLSVLNFMWERNGKYQIRERKMQWIFPEKQRRI